MVAHVSLEGSPDLCSDNPAQMRVRTHIPHNRRLANRTREDHLVDRSADHWVDRSADHWVDRSADHWEDHSADHWEDRSADHWVAGLT